MISRPTHLRRVLAARMRGETLWKASATDGQHTGKGVGYSWHAAVSEAVREIDEQHNQQVER